MAYETSFCPKCGSYEVEMLNVYEGGSQWECGECDCFWDET